MKRTIAIMVFAVMCMSMLMGCARFVPAAPQVEIHVQELSAGLVLDQVEVYVTLDGEPVECTTQWVEYSEEGFREMESGENLPENFWGRLDVYYFLPEGVAVEDVPVSVDAPGGTYDGTGEGATKDGCVQAWSHIQYGSQPQQSEQAASAEVLISVAPFAADVPLDQVQIEVQLNGEVVEHRAAWTQFSEDGFREMESGEKLPENFWGRLDVYYFLPEGVAVEDAAVRVNAPGGTYDGTGEGASKDGCVEAWSHIVYEQEQQEPEATPAPTSTPKPTATPKPTSTPKPTTSQSAHSHSWKRDASLSMAATCERDGYTAYSCSCGENYTEPIAASGHNWQQTATYPASCLVSGSKVFTCSRCGNTYTETIAELGHNYANATCLDSGSCTRESFWEEKCTRCASVRQYSKPASGHAWSGWSSCGNREHERKCSSCGTTDVQRHTLDSSGYCTACGEFVVN